MEKNIESANEKMLEIALNVILECLKREPKMISFIIRYGLLDRMRTILLFLLKPISSSQSVSLQQPRIIDISTIVSILHKVVESLSVNDANLLIDHYPLIHILLT